MAKAKLSELELAQKFVNELRALLKKYDASFEIEERDGFQYVEFLMLGGPVIRASHGRAECIRFDVTIDRESSDYE